MPEDSGFDYQSSATPGLMLSNTDEQSLVNSGVEAQLRARLFQEGDGRSPGNC
jgi:hypothetical protein